MAEIGLRTYIHQIDGLIEQKQLDDAVAHCKHILHSYPKNLEAYRLLGKALLEQSRHGDASDIFQRVLSAVPDDFVAHVGMSIVREDEANLEAALWHMERAFEANPANPAIQEELRRLYGRRDGVMPSRARLTRGALARMYVKGELYPQADAELQTALAEDPERLDLLTLRARVLLATGHRAEATDLVTELLHKLPYSQIGNRLMDEILRAQNRPEDALPCRQRLEALDPYEAYATDSDTAHVRDDAVRVPELSEIAARPAEAAPDWAVSLGETTPFGQPLETEAGDEPEWLKTGTGMLTAQPAAITDSQELPAAGEVPDWLKDVEPVTTTNTPELPDWMKATTGVLADADADFDQPKKKPTGSLSGWISKADDQAEEAAPTAAADLPDWMKDLAPETPAEPEPRTPTAWMTAPLGSAPEETPAGADSLPDWLTPAAGASDLPDWMQAGAAAGGATNLLGEAASPTEPLPAWLKSAASSENAPPWLAGDSAQPEATESPAEPAAEGLPDWLKAAAAEPPVEPETAAPAEVLPDWLKAVSAETSTPAELEAAAAAEDLPDWLRAASAETPAPAEPEAAVPASDMPDWLKAVAAEAPAETAAPAEDLPDWLRAASTETPAPAELEAAAPASDMPDWLKAVAAEAPAETAAPAEDLPDWLAAATAAPAAFDAAAAPAPKVSLPAAKPPVDLPDFLQPASAAAIERANTPVDWETAPPAAEAAPQADDSAVPDWIKAMAPDLSAAPPAAEDNLPPIATDELPDWLKPGAGAGLAAAEPAPLPPAAESDDLPDWLTAATAETPAPAAGSAAPAWLPTPAPADELPLPPADLPDWVQAAAPGVSDTVETWLTDKEVPAWLRQPGAAPASPPADWLRAPLEPAAQAEPPVGEPALPDWLQAPAEPPAPSPEPAGELPDLSSMDADQAMLWLEGLAAKQGAAADELISKPEDRLEMPPAWVQAAGQQAPAPAEELATPTPADELPDWLKAIQSEAEPAPEAARIESPAEPPAPSPEPAGELPDLSSMDADQAMLWLEGLAAKQGAAADELISKPEDRLEAPPAWVQAAGQAAPAPAEEVAAPTPADELPDWLKAIQSEAEPAPEAARIESPAEPPAPSPEPAGELPDLSSMDADQAMLWLEGLAAKQGAAADELISKPEDRLEAPPAWVQAAGQAAPAPAEEVAAPTPADELPDWLKAIQSEAEPAPEAAHLPPAEPPAPSPEPAGELPDLSSMDADQAMLWLEGLAAKQGAAADELISKPEDRLEAPPAWVQAAGQAAPAPAETPSPEPAAEADLPDWLKALQTETPPDWGGEAGLSGPVMPPTGILPNLADLLAADTDTAAEPTADADLPDWIKALQTRPLSPQTVAPAEPPAPSPEPAGEMPDLSSMDADQAMLWLEGLAAKQGAAADELISKPEDRLEAPPAWVQAAGQEVPASGAETPAPAEDLDGDETMRWLEGLAAKQGAAADELISKPEDRLTTPPDWVQAAERTGPQMPPTGLLPDLTNPAEPTESAGAPADVNTTFVPDWIAGYAPEPARAQPDWLKPAAAGPPAPSEEPPAIEEPAPEPVSDLPDWIRAVAGPEPEPPAAAAPVEPPAKPAAPPAEAPKPAEAPESGSQLGRLAERLAANRRAKELEVAERLERQRAEREAAQEEVAKSMEERRAARQTPGTGPLRPGTGPLKPGTGTLKPDTDTLKSPPAEPTPPAREAAKRAPAPVPVPTRVSRTRKTRGAKTAYAGQSPAEVLLLSRQRLLDRDFTNAADSLGHLIHGGHLVREVVAELEAATFNNPSVTVLYQVLGDAYMKDNQLQKALDAYRQALAQL